METIDITGINSAFDGVGRMRDGRVVFIPGAIPGEKVRAQITEDKGRFCTAALCDVLEPSPDRITPACPYAGACGGCQAQHIRYERTLELKKQIVTDALTRIGGLVAPIVREPAGCETPFRSRNKAEYPIDFREGRMVMGARARSSHRVVPLSDCLLQHTSSTHALQWFSAHLDRMECARHLKTIVTRVDRKGELMLILCVDAPIHPALSALAPDLFAEIPELKSLWMCTLQRRPAHALDGRCVHLAGKECLTDPLMGIDFSLSPQSFFQVNPVQTEKLYGFALEAAGLYPNCGRNVLDAYCGAGTITLSAARLAGHASGIEIVPAAIADAKRNAERNGLSDKTRFICADAALEIPRMLRRGERFDAVILDPPRKGVDEALLDAIAQAKIPIVTYVSCNPSTLARDIRRLSASGYRLQWAHPVDMFPWTSHVETVVLMSQK